MHRTSLELSIVTTIISYAISYILFLLATLITSFPFSFIVNSESYYNVRVFYRLAICIIHFIFTLLLFKLKRLRNGLSFLHYHSGFATPTLISLLILFIYLITINSAQNALFITLCFSGITLALIFYISLHSSITHTYQIKLRDRDLDILNEHLDNLETDYQKMTEDKDELARIVHRDNKLVPAMLLSVETFLTEFPDATPQMKKRGDELMAELREAAEGRKGIILQQDKKCTAKPIETGISALDEVLKYMQEKAMAKNITLSASADLGIEDLVSKTIDETDLKTLTNDLLENAIIANSYNNGTNVYFIIGYFDKRLAIHVYDSGIPFTKEVLVDLGVTKHTTHEEDGGSGIGSMEIFNIARKYRASYIIDEYDTYAGPYTKRISIIFDKRNKYTLNTSRPQDEINYLRQRADLNIEARKNRL